jgi:hypothetical protein
MKSLRFYLLLNILFFSIQAAVAQPKKDDFSSKKTMPSPFVIPFTLQNKIIIIQAKADKQIGNFIVDTGVATLILNKRYFTGFETDKIFYDVNGNPSKVTETFVNLEMGACKLRQEQAIITDFEELERTLHLPIMGSIGVTTFKKYELVLDYIFQELTIHELDKEGNRKYIYDLHDHPIDTIHFESSKSMPIILVTLGEYPLQVGLDTGSGVNLLNETMKPSLASHWIQLRNKDLVGITSRTQDLTVAQIQDVQVGKLRCAPMVTIFAPLQYFNKNLPGRSIDGIVGYEFLNQFRVAINFHKQEIYVWNKEVVEMQLAMRKGRK